MNAAQKQEKARIRDDVKRQLAAKGIPRERGEEFLKQIEDEGWAWDADQNIKGWGVIVCSCGVYAIARDPKLFKPQPCPNCGRQWKLAEVQ